MKRNKLVLFIIIVAMLVSVVGCGTKKETKVIEEKTDEISEVGVDIPTLKWVQVGSGMPKNYEKWKENMDKYLEEKIGVHMDVEVIPWGDWENRKSLMVNSGEYFDILFTNQDRYNSEVALGMFTDITELVKTETPDLYNYIPKDYWRAVLVGGKVYSVPTYKDSSATEYMVWDKAMIEKYDIDIDSLNTLDKLTDIFKEIRDGENIAPLKLYRNGFDAIFFEYDRMGAGLPTLGVKYEDETKTVVNILDEELVLSNLEILHNWYEEGIINLDAPALDEQSGYRLAYVAQGWPSAAQTTWGPGMGIEAVAARFSKTYVSNTTVSGSLNGIYSGSKYPKESLKFLELINQDSYVRDAFYYGLEGEDFEYTEDGKIKKLNADWTMAGYTQGTFFNLTQLESDESNQWEEVKELNAMAIPSVLLGFNLVTTDIETELAECIAIYEKYKSELLTGAKEPRALTQKMTEELNAAGYQKIIIEAQRQVDAFGE